MSEKQAKKQRKTQTDTPHHSPAQKKLSLFNVALVLVIIAVLALGTFAVVRNYEPKVEAPQTQTVAQYAESVGMTADEFLAEYGLSGVENVTADTDINTASGEMTVENYAKYTSVTVDQLKEDYSLGEAVTNEMTWRDATGYIPVSKAAEMSGMTYEQLLEMYNLTEEQLPRDMTQSEAAPILQQAYEASMAAQENESDGDNAAEGEAQQGAE